ncbi:MAG: caspase family protein, partial [Vicingaceae bacterium]
MKKTIIVGIISFLFSMDINGQIEAGGKAVRDSDGNPWIEYLEDFSKESSYTIKSMRALTEDSDKSRMTSEIKYGKFIISLNPYADVVEVKRHHSLLVNAHGIIPEVKSNIGFEVETKFKTISDHSYQFIFELKGKEHYLSFSYKPFTSENDLVRIVNGQNKYNSQEIFSSSSDKINYNTTDYNQLKIRLFNNVLSIFINNEIVVKLEDIEFIANTINFEFIETKKKMFPFSGVLEIDFIRILNGNENIVSKSIQENNILIGANSNLEIEKLDKSYYALIIGNNNYVNSNITDLDQPIVDATRLYTALTSKYTFKKENVTFLKDATRRDMIIAFDNLTNTLTENDNLLIFYAGHGHWDSDRETGYWLPVDAEPGITVDWVRNSTVQGYIEDIKAKHTLLIADACFGGGIFKTRAAFDDADRSINNLYKFDSRKA